jgi:hypothetical protein
MGYNEGAEQPNQAKWRVAREDAAKLRLHASSSKKKLDAAALYLTDPQVSPRLKCLSDTQKEHLLDGARTGYQSKEEEKVSFKARGTI